MNIKKQTTDKLYYWNNSLEDLKQIDTSRLTKDARHYIEDSITKAKKNIEYYEEILKILEG